MKKKYIYWILLFVGSLVSLATVFFVVKNGSAETLTTSWQIQSIDTMKYSRDAAKDPTVIKDIPTLVKRVADMKATYIAIGTPYDQEFYPVLNAWVTEARKYNLHVWFRGNFSSWEGWFGYPQLQDVAHDHVMIEQFIIDHPELFQDGDIFTPVPEAENGAIGDPRGSDTKAKEYNQFLVDSYNNCVQSFNNINKKVLCGYFSMNGDVAKMILTKDTVDKIGGVVVIDHYVDTPQRMGMDLDFLHSKFNAKIILGEFGGPIPDINGNMTEDQQAAFVGELLNQFYLRRNFIQGINYWTLAGGSTSLLNDNYTPRLVTEVIKSYYSPNVWRGTITDPLGDTVPNIHVAINTKEQTTTDNGQYILTTPQNTFSLLINADGYTSYSEQVNFHASKEITQHITLEPVSPSLWYQIRLFIKNVIFSK